MYEMIEYSIQSKSYVWKFGENDYSFTSLYGEDGWCRGCGRPLREQCGPLTLESAKYKSLPNAWIPGWYEGAPCVNEATADALQQAGFNLELRPIAWSHTDRGAAYQIIQQETQQNWWRASDVQNALRERHGDSTTTHCSRCGNDRWQPLNWNQYPPIRKEVRWDAHYICSPEGFGAGFLNYQFGLMSRRLFDFLKPLTRGMKPYPVAWEPSPDRPWTQPGGAGSP